jgi:DNA-binding MarR family transcriptional regulator
MKSLKKKAGSTRRAITGKKKSVPGDDTSAPEADISLDHVIYNVPGFLARRFQQIGVSIFLEETKNYDITPLQYGVMAAVRATPGVDQRGVSAQVGLDSTTVMGIVDRLERKGLIARHAVEHDRRVRRLFLTPAGTRRLIEVKSAVDRVQTRLLEPLSDHEGKVLLASLSRIVSYHNKDSRVPISDAALRATITGSSARRDAGLTAAVKRRAPRSADAGTE